MRYRASWPITTFALAMLIGGSAGAQQSMATGRPMDVTFTDSLKWNPVAPPGFEQGLEMAVVSGDPSVAGQPYVLRLRFPSDYRFPAHWHPVAENLTVLEGRFLIAPGEQRDDSKLKTYRPGDFLHFAAKHPHFGSVRGATTLTHARGPTRPRVRSGSGARRPRTAEQCGGVSR
jgi:quercetin dioxygenase-like cupin family protein